MRRFSFFLSIVISGSALIASREIPLPYLANPGRIAVDSSRIFMIDGYDIYILSREDFSILKKFGKQGEGPEEFIVHQNDPPGFSISQSQLIISAQNKVLEFDKSGEFVRQIKSGTKGIACKPYQDGFVGMERPVIDGKFSASYQYYYQGFQNANRIYHYVDDFQNEEGFQLLKNPYQYHYTFETDKDFIYIFLKEKPAIGVFDEKGNLVRSIRLDYPALKVPSNYAKDLIQYWKTDAIKKQYYPYLKPITVAEYFPALREFRLSEEKIYVMTYQRKSDLNRCLIYKKNGDLEEQTWIPLIEKDPMEFYPFSIHDGVVFQLVEGDSDDWILQISEIN